MREPNAVDKYIRVNPQSHIFEPVWAYRDIMPYTLGPDPAYPLVQGFLDLSALTPNDSINVPYKLPHASILDNPLGNPLKIDEIMFETVNHNAGAFGYPEVTVFLTDMGDVRQFMNAPIHIQTFAGNGQLAARLAEPLFLPTRHQLNFKLAQSVNTPADGSGSYIIALFMSGQIHYTWSSNLQKYPHDHAEVLRMVNYWLERRKYVSPYWLTTDNGPVFVAPGQTVDADANIGSEGHFEATHIMWAPPSTIGPASDYFEVEFYNPQTRQTLMNGRIHNQMIGNAYNPQPLPAPFIVPAGQLIHFRITGLANANVTQGIYLTLRGMKIRAPFKSYEEVNVQLGHPNVHSSHDKSKKSMTQEMAGVRP